MELHPDEHRFSKEDNTDMKEQIITQEQFDSLKEGSLLVCTEANDKWFTEGRIYTLYIDNGDKKLDDGDGDLWNIYLRDGEIVEDVIDTEYKFSIVRLDTVDSTEKTRGEAAKQLREAVVTYNKALEQVRKYGMNTLYAPLSEREAITYTAQIEEY